MSAAPLLARLEGVRQRTPGSWMARCPGPLHAKGDRHASLSVRETEDGVVLLRCFSGCQVGDIAAAVGLNLTDLFPPRPTSTHHGKPRRKPPILSGDVLLALHHDLLVIAQAARQILKTGLLPDEMHAFIKAVDHVEGLLEAVRHG